MAVIQLKSLTETNALGAKIGSLLAQSPPLALLLKGNMGCGKTALTRAIVSAMPNSELCEIASPSFNICNFYPVFPPVLHCDFYRCQNAIPEEALEALQSLQAHVIVEWAEYLPETLAPKDYLDIFIKIDKNIRLANIVPSGANALNFLQILLNDLAK